MIQVKGGPNKLRILVARASLRAATKSRVELNAQLKFRYLEFQGSFA